MATPGKRFRFCAYLAVGVGLLGGVADSGSGQALARDEEAALWAKSIAPQKLPYEKWLQQPVLDNWELIADVRVVKEGAGISNTAAVMGSLVLSRNWGGPEMTALTPNNVLRAAEKTRGKPLSLDERNTLLSRAAEDVRKSGEDLQALFRVPDKDKINLREEQLTRYLARYVQEGDLVASITKFEKERLFAPQVEAGVSLPFAKYKEAIDKGLPLAVRPKAGDRWRVAFGYLLEGDAPYLLVGDPQEVERQEIPGLELLPEREKAGAAPSSLALAAKKRFAVSLRTGITPQIPKGIHIEKFESTGRAAVIYHGTGVPDEAALQEYVKPLLPTEEKEGGQ